MAATLPRSPWQWLNAKRKAAAPEEAAAVAYASSRITLFQIDPKNPSENAGR
jgi:hypothetical protein